MLMTSFLFCPTAISNNINKRYKYPDRYKVGRYIFLYIILFIVTFDFAVTVFTLISVSYTHLDVYKRQPILCPWLSVLFFLTFFPLLK